MSATSSSRSSGRRWWLHPQHGRRHDAGKDENLRAMIDTALEYGPVLICAGRPARGIGRTTDYGGGILREG